MRRSTQIVLLAVLALLVASLVVAAVVVSVHGVGERLAGGDELDPRLGLVHAAPRSGRPRARGGRPRGRARCGLAAG